MQSEIRISQQTLQNFARELLIRIGMSPEDATIEAEVLVWANLRGKDSHGVLQIPFYVQEVDEGYMNPRPNIEILQETPSTMTIEGDLAFGAVVTVFAMKKAMVKAKESGICWAFIRNTSHQGAMGYYPLMAAGKGMAGIIFTCTPPSMVPYGAKVAGVDNSPLAIAVPAKRYKNIVLDMATSITAWGKIALAKDKGLAIPEGWALDKDGLPTTDPVKAATVLPIGGPKGSGLALMFECLSSLLVNNPLLEPALYGTRDFGKHQIQNSVVLVLDIGSFTNVEEYRGHIDSLIDGLKDLPTAEGFSEILFPGESADRIYADRIENGIPLPEGTVKRIQSIAQRYGVALLL